MVELLRRLLERSTRERRPGSPPAGGRRAAHFLHALDEAASAMRGRSDQRELFEVIGRSLSTFGFWTSILMLDGERKTLRITYLSNDSEMLSLAETLLGSDRDSFRIVLDRSPFHRALLDERATRFLPDGFVVLRDVLPNVPAPVLRTVSRLIGFRGVIGTTLLDGDRAVGLMVVSAPDLTEHDVTIVRLFAAQLSATMRTFRLVDDLERSLTDLESTKSQLLEAQQRETIGLLAGGVAHDFNNLLSAITLSTEMISASADQHVAADLEIIRQSCERGSNLVAQLLALGRQTELEMQPFDLDEMLHDLHRLLVRVLGEDVRVLSALSEEPTIVEGDRAQLEQVLINLAVNARDAMPEGGTLSLRTRLVECDAPEKTTPTGGCVEIEVTDSGAGMDAETCRRAFDPFFTTKGRARGTGLGLSVVRSIVEQHGGTIDLASTPGSGTTFRIRLPRGQGSPARTPAASPRPMPSGHGELILVVEDDRLVRKSCSRILRRAGWNVRSVADGASARAAVAELRDAIALIFCDVILPDERGTRLLADLLRLVPDVAVLVTSGYVDERADEELIAARGWPFLGKPYRHDELISRVHALLRGGAAVT